MLSVIVYGRNDSYGYNLHKRAALSFNCIAELLTDESDEIVFVDYNTPNDFPTFPEAIADTLTEKAVRKLRILRVRPELHSRIAKRTHLSVVEPVARNVAVRRSNPENRWILSTNTDMIFDPVSGDSLTRIVDGLDAGFYHLPRYEIPESIWEGFNRHDPLSVLKQVRELGDRLHLREIVYQESYSRFDGCGDFQLVARSDLFRIHGFNEDMLLGWHVDSNLAKRLHLLHGRTGDLIDRLSGYHCDHTRQVTEPHRAKRKQNSLQSFIDDVTAPELPRQASHWGFAGDDIEEIRLGSSPGAAYLDGLLSSLGAAAVTPYRTHYTPEFYNRVGYEPKHVLPYLTDILTAAPRTYNVGWIGLRAETFDLFRNMWQALGFRGRIHVPPCWTAYLRIENDPAIALSSVDEMGAACNVFVFDFSSGTGDARGGDDASSQSLFNLDPVLKQVMQDFLRLVRIEQRSQRSGKAARRFVGINVVHGHAEWLFRNHVAAAQTPMSTRIRHGEVYRKSPHFKDALVLSPLSVRARAWVRERPRIRRLARLILDGLTRTADLWRRNVVP